MSSRTAMWALLCLVLVWLTCISAIPLERRGEKRYVAALTLFGTPECAYTTDLIVGGVKTSVIVDTGSSHIAVASKGCSGCETVPEPLYSNPNPTGPAVKVTYGMHAFESWWSGMFTNEVIGFPVGHTSDGTGSELGPVNTKIAVIQTSSNFFIPACPFAQGIWGQAYRGITGSLDYTFIDNLAVAGVPEGFAVELCRRDPVVPGKAETERNLNNKTGNLWLGGLDGSHVSGSLEYISIAAQTWYQINLESFVINGIPIAGLSPLTSSKAIIDSGTTDIMISNENFATVKAAMRASKMLVFSNAIADSYVTAFWDQTYILKLPNTEFTFDTTVKFGVVIDGKRFDMDLQNFLFVVPDDSRPNWSILSFSGISGGGPQSSSNSVGSILGIPFMMGKVVFFDRAPRADYPLGRIGVANSQKCYEPTSAAAINIFAAVNATSPFSITQSTSSSSGISRRTTWAIFLWTSIVLVVELIW